MWVQVWETRYGRIPSCDWFPPSLQDWMPPQPLLRSRHLLRSQYQTNCLKGNINPSRDIAFVSLYTLWWPAVTELARKHNLYVRSLTPNPLMPVNPSSCSIPPPSPRPCPLNWLTACAFTPGRESWLTSGTTALEIIMMSWGSRIYRSSILTY